MYILTAHGAIMSDILNKKNNSLHVFGAARFFKLDHSVKRYA